MISKILHFIWLGGGSTPKIIIKSWRDHHPDYDIIIWGEQDIDNLGLLNYDHYKKAGRRYNQKSDIARYEILHRFGGVYVDSDIFCIKNIDPLLQDSFFSLFEKKGLVSNSIIACEKNNLIMRQMINHIHENYDYNETIWKCTGPMLFTKILSKTEIQSHSPEKFNYRLCGEKNMFLLEKHAKFQELSKQIKLDRSNNSLKYQIDIDDIYGLQLFLGGKRRNYNILSRASYKDVQKNIAFFINIVKNNLKSNEKFDTKFYRN